MPTLPRPLPPHGAAGRPRWPERAASRLRASGPSVCLALLVLLLLTAAAGCGTPGSGQSTAAGSPGATPGTTGQRLVAHRADFEQTVLLTGEIEAVRSVVLVVPETPSWRVELRWLAEDGSLVEAGDRVAELDDTEFVDVLEENELALEEKLAELERKKAETTSSIREREFEVKRSRAEVEKARIKADLPEGIVPRQDLADRELELAKAEAELEKALADLESERESSAADLEIQRIEIEKARREIDAASKAIDALALEAPVPGLFLVAELPWEDRTLQEGDTVWTGLPVGSIPDLSSLRVVGRLPDVDDGRVAVGMPARVVLDAYPERVIAGTVSEVSSIAREEGRESLRRFFQVVVTLAESDPGSMIPGMSARVEVVRERRNDALVVPRQALMGVGAGTGSPTPALATGTEPADLREAPPSNASAASVGEGSRTRVLRADGESVPVRLGPCNPLVCVVEEGIEESTPVAVARGTSVISGASGGLLGTGEEAR